MGQDTGGIKEDEELMTVGEVARLLKAPVSWVYERCREGTPKRGSQQNGTLMAGRLR